MPVGVYEKLGRWLTKRQRADQKKRARREAETKRLRKLFR